MRLLSFNELHVIYIVYIMMASHLFVFLFFAFFIKNGMAMNIRFFQNKKGGEYTKDNFNELVFENAYLQKRKLISISHNGLDGFYVMGILSFIMENYNLDDYFYYGTSSGAWNALFMSSSTLTNYKEITDVLLHDDNQFTKLFGKRVNKVHYKYFMLDYENTIKNNIQNICRGDGGNNMFNYERLFIGMNNYVTPLCKNTHIYTDFDNLADVFNVCMTSSNIFFSKYRGYNYINNVFTKYSSHSTGFPLQPILHINPFIFTGNSKITHKLLFNLELATQYNTIELFHYGYNDAKYNREYLDKKFVM